MSLRPALGQGQRGDLKGAHQRGSPKVRNVHGGGREPSLAVGESAAEHQKTFKAAPGKRLDGAAHRTASSRCCRKLTPRRDHDAGGLWESARCLSRPLPPADRLARLPDKLPTESGTLRVRVQSVSPARLCTRKGSRGRPPARTEKPLLRYPPTIEGNPGVASNPRAGASHVDQRVPHRGSNGVHPPRAMSMASQTIETLPHAVAQSRPPGLPALPLPRAY